VLARTTRTAAGNRASGDRRARSASTYHSSGVRIAACSTRCGMRVASRRDMDSWKQRTARAGRVRPMLLLWALGIPLPIILIVVLMRGCA